MTIQQLKYVIALSEHGHFVRASEACFVTQPTLTAQVKKLEDELGLTLFDRSTRPIRLTDAGERLLQEAKQVVASSSALEKTAQRMQAGVAGSYELSIIPTLAPYLLPLFLEGFVQENPSVELVVNERTTDLILADLNSGKIDIAILVTPIRELELEALPLFYEPLIPYLSKGHPLLENSRISRRSIAGEALWLLGEGHCFREQMLNLCDHDKCALYSNLYYGSGSIETMKRMVQHGKGMTLVPELALNPSDERARRFSAPEPTREVSLVFKKHFPKQELIRMLASAIKSAVPEKMLERPESVINWQK